MHEQIHAAREGDQRRRRIRHVATEGDRAFATGNAIRDRRHHSVRYRRRANRDPERGERVAYRNVALEWMRGIARDLARLDRKTVERLEITPSAFGAEEELGKTRAQPGCMSRPTGPTIASGASPPV